jgi:hypothetical protein
MRKLLVAISAAVILVAASIFVTCKYQAGSHQVQTCTNQHDGAATGTAALSNRKNATDNTQNRSEVSSWWYLLLAWPEGITTLAIISTLFVIGWQSWETRKAAEAANLGMEITKTKERAKLLLTIEPLNPVVGEIPEAKLRVTNVGESSAIFGMAIAGLDISESDALIKDGSGYYGLKVGYSLLKAEESSVETVWWPADPFLRYSQAVIEGEKEIVHLHGIINFKDAFEDWWRLRFHYIWRHYAAEVWIPHLQHAITGEWEDQNEEGECRIEKPLPKPWWRRWFKDFPVPKVQNPN